jgi:hypothetical protein
LKANEKSVHIDVAPIVYSASSQPEAGGQRVIPVFDIKDHASKTAANSPSPSAALPPQPIVTPAKRPRHGFFGKIKGLMARIF